MPSPVDMNSPVAYYPNSPLLVFGSRKPIEHAINLAPNLSLLPGTVLGEIAAQPGTFKPYAGSTVGTPASLTPTLTTSATGGSLAGSQTVYVVFTWKNGAGETVKSTEASIAIPAGTATNSVTATAPQALPPGAIGTNWYIGTVSGTDYFAVTSPGNSAVIPSLSSGTVAPPGSSTAIAATDGSQVAKCILPAACVTDPNGNIYFGSPFAATTGIPSATVQATPYGGFAGLVYPEPCVDAYFGAVECWAGDLYGLDSAAISAGFGRIENGVLGGAGAVFRLP